jgi:integrase
VVTVAARPSSRSTDRTSETENATVMLSQDLIENDPSAGIASFGASPRRDRVLLPDEIKILWDWIPTSRMPGNYANALKFQLATGARIGEVGGIRAEEIDRENWLWTLPADRSKNGRPRVTPLVGFAREILERRLEEINEGPLFRTEKGDPLTSNCVASLLVKRRKDIPIEHFTSHDLRRTVATELVDLGFSFEVVAAILGHEAGNKDVRTLVRHYIRSGLIEQKRKGLEAWQKRLQQIVNGQTLPPNVDKPIKCSDQRPTGNASR